MLQLLASRLALALLGVVLVGCSATHAPGYQHVYQGYNVPQSLVERIERKFQEYGLKDARVRRDPTGRIQLAGSYDNEEQVETAFLITQSIVGLKSTSPFYPENVRERRWAKAASEALEKLGRQQAQRSGGPARRLALVIGISHFKTRPEVPSIMGEEDGLRMKELLLRHNYEVTALLGPQATKAAMEAAIEQMKQKIGPNDTVVLYVSSHGMQPVSVPGYGVDERSMSILAFDSSTRGAAREDKMVSLQRTAVKDTLLTELLRLKSRATLAIVDTCYSGEMLAGIPADESTRYVAQSNGGKVERAGVSMGLWSGAAFSSKNIRVSQDGGASAQRPMPVANAPARQALNINDGNGGRSVITATSEGERSWGPDPERSPTFISPLDRSRRLKGSFFTQAFVEYIEASGGNVHDAFDSASRFTAEMVSNEVRRTDPSASQHPRWVTNIPRQDNHLYRQ